MDDVPKLVSRYMNGEMPLDKFITQEMKWNQVNEVFELMHQGKSLRSVLSYDNE